MTDDEREPPTPRSGPEAAAEAEPAMGPKGAAASERVEAEPAEAAAHDPSAPATPAPPEPPPIAAQEPAAPSARATPSPLPRRAPLEWLAERPEEVVEFPRERLTAQSRRAFLIAAAGTIVTAAGAWWLLPDRTKARLLPGPARDRLDTLAARVGLSPGSRERVLDGALTFDDDVAEALYSKDRRVRTYERSQVTPLRNNYNGRTPGPEYLATWSLEVSGLASGATQRLDIEALGRLPFHEQVTRLVCVEGWSAVAWWGGVRFADLLEAFPPAPSARWAAMRSAVNLDYRGQSDPYYVSIDLDTARHPQTLLATHLSGQPLGVDHGAPLRLLVPMKLGLKNIKAVTHIAYMAEEPADYWNERGYSKYDGL